VTIIGTRRGGVALALGAAGISGVAVFLNSYGVKSFGSASLYTTAKNTVAALVLLAVAIALVTRHRGGVVTRPRRAGEWIGLAAVAVVGGSVPFVLFFEGLSRASSTQAAFLQKTLLVWVALLALPLLHERLGVAHWAAIALLVGGQVTLAGGVGALLRMSWGGGEWMVLAATLMWSVEVIVVKRLLGGLTSWTVGLVRMGAGSLLLLGWTAWHGDLTRMLHLDTAQWGWVLLTGAILAAYVGTWFAALARAQAVDVTAVLVLAAVITATLNAVVQGVSLRPQVSGLTMVAVGVALVAAQMRRRRAPVAVT
jgi:drug/metabolite transporter (DMT)-like permease